LFETRSALQPDIVAITTITQANRMLFAKYALPERAENNPRNLNIIKISDVANS